MTNYDWERFSALMGTMTDREWRDIRDRIDQPIERRQWTELLSDDYERMLAHFYVPRTVDPDTEANRQRARVAASWLLRSQTDGRLCALLAERQVAELEALVRILERQLKVAIEPQDPTLEARDA